SDSYSPDEMSSPEHISPLPAISTFLCIDSSEAPDSFDRPPSQDLYVMAVARWRIKVASRLSSSSEFPIAPVIAPPRIRRRSQISIEACITSFSKSSLIFFQFILGRMLEIILRLTIGMPGMTQRSMRLTPALEIRLR
ncbi:hypothetical protein Tco_0342303, partial [Tanacetum coccineum]